MRTQKPTEKKASQVALAKAARAPAAASAKPPRQPAKPTGALQPGGSKKKPSSDGRNKSLKPLAKWPNDMGKRPKRPVSKKRVQEGAPQWSGVEYSEVQWSIVEWSGVEWSGVLCACVLQL